MAARFSHLAAGSPFDLKTYWGRVRHFFTMVDPRNALITDAELDTSKKLVEGWKAKTLPPSVTDADLWAAKRKLDAVVHPDTGEKIPLLGRLSMFMPANLPITAGMLLTGPVRGGGGVAGVARRRHGATGHSARGSCVQ